MGVPPANGSDGGLGITGGEDLHLLPQEHIITVHCNQAYYGTVSDRGEEYSGHGWPIGGGNMTACTGKGRGWRLKRRNGRRGGGYGDDGDGDGLNRWEDTVANVILGTEPNVPISYTTVFELHQPIMSMFGAHRNRLEKERDRITEIHGLNYPGNKESKIIDTT